MAQAKYCKHLNGTISQFTAQYTELYNDVFGQTGSFKLTAGPQKNNVQPFMGPQTSGLSSAVSSPMVVHTPKVGRNDPCPCGSGKKYKKCCLK